MANFTRYKIPNDFLKRMINYKLINVLPSFKWKLNGWKEKRSTQYRNIFDNSFSPSKLTDRKNRLEKKKKNIVIAKIPSIRRNEKTYLFRNADPPVSIVGTKLFQSGFKCLNENFILLSTARKIIFYCIYFSPFFLFFFSLHWIADSP